MTTGHIVTIIIAGLVVLGIMAIVHMMRRSAADTLDIDGAPEAEADRRFTTKVQKGHRTFIL